MCYEDAVKPKKKYHPDETALVSDFFGHKTSGIFVEVGANDPKYRSQTWHLEEKGWSGVLVEPQSRLCEALRAVRHRSQVFQVACAAPNHPEEAVLFLAERHGESGLGKDQLGVNYVGEETVKLLTLDEILRQAGNPEIDFISIDVEGLQLPVLQGFGLAHHRPKLLIIEDRFQSCQTHLHLCRQGYRLVRRSNDLNNWYVPRESSFRANLATRLKLFRFVWLGTPFRRFKFWWRGRKNF